MLGVLETGSEVEMLINEIGCGKVSEPGNYKAVEDNIGWFVSKAGSDELVEMGRRGHEYLINHLTKDISVEKYIETMHSI